MGAIARNLLVLAGAIALFWLAAEYLLPGQEPVGVPPTAVELSHGLPVPQRQPTQKLLADISLHSVEELELLFDRVEQQLQRPLSEGEQPLVSLILHGPEVEYFALKNYGKYKDVVDRAARLAAFGAVDISICQTQMRNYGLSADEVPSFLRQVPYGPGEVRKLLDEGFVYM